MRMHKLHWRELGPETARDLLLALGSVGTDEAASTLIDEANKMEYAAIKDKVDRPTYLAVESFIDAAIIEACEIGVRAGVALMATSAGNFRMGDKDAWLERAVEYAGLLDYAPRSRYEPPQWSPTAPKEEVKL